MTIELPDEDVMDEDAMPDPESAPAPRRGAKRGRTEGIPEWWDEAMRMTGGYTLYAGKRAGTSYYEVTAMQALGCGKDPAFAWLLPAKESDWKASLLVELGRFGDAATIRALAAELCATRPKIRAALAALRLRRTGDPAPPPRPLAEAIVGLVESHLGRYPATSSQAVRDAVVRAAVVLNRRLTERDREDAQVDAGRIEGPEREARKTPASADTFSSSPGPEVKLIPPE